MGTLSLYIGRAGTGKTQSCFEAIQHIRQNYPGESIIVLVPDSATYHIERSLAEFTTERGFTTVRVVGFGRLAYQIFQSIGKNRNESISELGSKLLLRLILKEKAKELVLFRNVARQPHFADIMQGLINECKAFGVEATDFLEAAKELSVESSMVLREKIRELSLIIEQYDERLGLLLGNTKHPLEELIEALNISPIMENSHVIIDGFHWFTPIQMKVIHNLIQKSKDTIITLTLPGNPKSIQEQSLDGALFHRTWEVYNELIQHYSNIQITYFEDNKRFQKKVLANLEEKFFNRPSKRNDVEEGLSLTVAYNQEREVDAMCRKILEYMEIDGHRWKDVVIMLREENTYGDVLEKLCNTYHIPYFTDRRNPMMTHPISEFLNSLLEVVENFFQHDTMFRLLKTDLFPLDRESVDKLENYCLEFGINGKLWLVNTWDYEKRRLMRQSEQKRDALTEDENFETDREVRINDSKSVVMKILGPFYEFSRTEHSGQEWIEGIFKLIMDLEIPQTLKKWAETAKESGDVVESNGHEQMYKHVVALFDEVIMISREEMLDLSSISLIIEEGLKEVTYSLVPPSLDHVMITTIERGYTRECEVLFLLGLNDGVFPQRIGDEGVLNDQDRETLKAAGITLAEGALRRSFNENFLLYLACTRAKKELYVSYAGSDETGAAMEPSLVVQRLEQLGYITKKSFASLSIPEGKELDYAWRPLQSLSLLANSMSDFYRGEAIDSFWWSLYNWGLRDGRYKESVRYATRGIMDTNKVVPVRNDIVKGLLFKGSAMTGSVTRLEKYQACPYQFYAQYALKLEKRKIKSFGSPEIGTFLHESLRHIGMNLLSKKMQWRDVTEDLEAGICTDAVVKVKKELGHDDSEGFQNVLLERLEKTLNLAVHSLVDWSKKSTFDMTHLEQGFGRYDGVSWKPIYIPLGTAEGEEIRLQGQIDRIDTFTDEEKESYVAVIDYKTGGASVNGSSIFYGLKLQLMTYLLALKGNIKGTSIQPAATVYTYVRHDTVKTSSILTREMAQLARMEAGCISNGGYFTSYGEILQDLDNSRGFSKGTAYVPVRTKKDGEIHSDDIWKTKTQKEFEVLTDYTVHMMTSIGNSVMDGQFPISPYRLKKNTPCKYCQYKALCRFEGSRQKYRDLASLSEAEAMLKMDLEKGGNVYEMDNRPTKRH